MSSPNVPVTASRGINADILLSEIRFEVELAWQRKASLENRAFAVFTLNLAVATLYLAIRPQTKVDEITLGTWAAGCLIATFAFLIASMVGAVVAVLPRQYPQLSTSKMTILAGQTETNVPFDEVFAKARLRNLQDVEKKNQTKAIIISWVLIGSGCMVVGFVGVFVLNYLGL